MSSIRGKGSATVVSLFSDFPEKFAVLVLASLRLRDIVDYWDEVFIERFNDEVIRKNGRTARNTIVSDTAQRIAVHRPDKDRFARFS